MHAIYDQIWLFINIILRNCIAYNASVKTKKYSNGKNLERVVKQHEALHFSLTVNREGNKDIHCELFSTNQVETFSAI